VIMGRSLVPFVPRVSSVPFDAARHRIQYAVLWHSDGVVGVHRKKNFIDFENGEEGDEGHSRGIVGRAMDHLRADCRWQLEDGHLSAAAIG
jgi:hypothetical protein